MNKKDEEIQRKLQELESVVLKESLEQSVQPPAVAGKSSELLNVKSNPPAQQAQPSIQNELCYFGGIGLIITGLIMLFQHVRVGTGFLAAFGVGGGGFGLILVPLLIGVGWLMYNPKNRWAWMVTIGTCAAVLFGILNSLVMSFPTMTLLGTILMLLPFAAGGALLLKGIGGPKGIEDKLKDK